MNLVDRVKKILMSPKTEWDVISAEATTNQQLVVGYVLPLAAVAAIAAFIGQVVIGVSVPFMGTMRVGVLTALVGLVFAIVMAVVMVFVLGFIADALAPSFGGQKNMAQAVKVAAYSYTPVWIVGILAIIPALGLLGILAAIYAIYLMYLGLPKLMKAPEDKAVGYTVVVVIAAIVVGFVVATIGSLITAPAMMASHMGSPSARFDKDSPMGKLDDFARKMEAQSKKMEEAQKSGDPNKQMEAALGALGTALSGGKAVDPVQIDALKPFVPEKFAGLPRTDIRTERSGVSGLMVAKAEGEYREGDKRVKLEVTDTGGAAALLGMAAWLGVQGEKEDSNRRESTKREGTRIVHEEVDKRGGHNEYTVVIGNRFVVSAEGNADIGALKSAVNGLDLGKIESLK
ncbi:MAG TPA: Yip1 family protein [Usitatibacter sp.]|nr:Yip1 family protein [Usitatibacter sp.]